MYGDSVLMKAFPYYQEGLGSKTWDQLSKPKTYALGLNLIHPDYKPPKCEFDYTLGKFKENPELENDPRYCCYKENWDDYNSKTKISNEWKKYTSTDHYKKYCMNCDAAYDYMAAKGEYKGNHEKIGYLDEKSRIVVDGTEQKYWYCCDYDHYTDEFKGKVSLAKFNKDVASYCWCLEDDYTDLVNFDTNYGTKKATKLDTRSINKDKMLINGKPQAANYCCYLRNYREDLKESLKTITEPGWTKLDKKLILKTPNSGICAGYCTYSLLEKGITKYVDFEGNEMDCCSYENYGSTDSERKKNANGWGPTKFEASPAYKEFCTAVACEWKGPDNTEPIQTVTKIVGGKEVTEQLNCCDISNYSDGEKSPYISSTDWQRFHDKKCNYCTYESVKNGDTTCCSDISRYEPTVQNFIRSNYYGNLADYLKDMITEAKYKEVCAPSSCYYGIDSFCPDCGSDITSTSRTMDTVIGEDSTKLDVTEDILNCIFENKYGGSDYDGYYYDSKSNRYCEVYCT